MKKTKYNVVSLYSGAGGLDLGFKKAGFNIIWANDFDRDSCETYRNNVGSHIREGDIDSFKEELFELSASPDLLIGGPPCQGFSVAGKMDPKDPRSKHVWNFVEILGKLKPKIFVMENVKALGVLGKWKSLRNELLVKMRDLGYLVNYIVLNATEFNVPQARERVFFIGFKRGLKENLDLPGLLEDYKIAAPSVRETLNVLSKAGYGNNSSKCNAKITLTKKPVMRKSPHAGMLFNGLGRPIKLDGYCSTLPASMGGNKTPIIDEKELYEFKKNWAVEYHSNLLKGKTKPDYKEAPSHLRRLTVEEATLIQTFPIGYKFSGSQSSKFRQIGNAVPCNLAFQVAKMILDSLDGCDKEKEISIKVGSSQIHGNKYGQVIGREEPAQSIQTVLQ